MPSIKIRDNIHYVGSIDFDRTIFDELVPTPQGTTYNSYIIQGSEKTALIDTVDPHKEWEILRNLESLNIKKIDYIISHHGEQDHSGTIPKILEMYPEAIVITNAKCNTILQDLLHIKDDKVKVIEDGDKLSLGDKTLKFIFTPWVHWPETFVSYLEEDKILFSCDLFGSHLAFSNIFAKNDTLLLTEAKRYYAEIMMPFAKYVKKHLETLSAYDIKMICPSHGPVYDKPEFIIDAHNKWVSDKTDNLVLLPYVSMHGSTLKMVDYLTDELIKRGIEVIRYNLTNSDIGDYAMRLIDATTVVLASPVVLGGAHPSAVYAAYLTDALKPKTKLAAIMGSCSWNGKPLERFQDMIGHLKAEVLEPVIVKGMPREEDYKMIENLADKIMAKHKEFGVL